MAQHDAANSQSTTRQTSYNHITIIITIIIDVRGQISQSMHSRAKLVSIPCKKQATIILYKILGFTHNIIYKVSQTKNISMCKLSSLVETQQKRKLKWLFRNDDWVLLAFVFLPRTSKEGNYNTLFPATREVLLNSKTTVPALPHLHPPPPKKKKRKEKTTTTHQQLNNTLSFPTQSEGGGEGWGVRGVGGHQKAFYSTSFDGFCKILAFLFTRCLWVKHN